ncbi:MAG: aminotransferase class I/II-fold pyridoxal phosphate-dependent enzyme [Acidobacteria bacterium]|nr:aminotransferase class I/II-fold pyridoxal phosphate-dependent enzyme [Acidobacteriota bacterium]
MSLTRSRISHKASRFTESVIREMTRLANRHNAINLAQGFPNFPAPEEIKNAACAAIQNDVNQYSITWGSAEFRRSIAEKYRTFYGWEVDPEREITVGCGSTECMIASILALVDPGDRVVIFEPFYENYGPDAIIAGARPVFIPLDSTKGWSFDPELLENKIRSASKDTGIRALILNTPNNPTGRVFSLAELQCISELAQRYNFYVLTDEIYEHITYEGCRHYPIALLPGMEERTVTISGLSKTFSVTGWRIGYIIAPPDCSSAIRKMHDFLTVGAAAPLQEAGVAAFQLGQDYYRKLAEDYTKRRDFLGAALTEAGFKIWKPFGAYYMMADISGLTHLGDVEFVNEMICRYGVAAVPGSSFFHDPQLGKHLVRFAFCKSLDVLSQAAERLMELGKDFKS